MNPVSVVIAKIAGQGSFEMAVIEDDNVVEALAADAADQAPHIRRLPG